MTFSFGENWLRYSTLLDESRVLNAERSLQRLLQRGDIDGLSFLDIGSGSGLFSIAAVKLGAKRVVAVDRDNNCLMVTRRNIDRFLSERLAGLVEVRKGDILYPETIGLEPFDIVYAWGSLHHTGAMWQAIENAVGYCNVNGHFVFSIYNQTLLSPGWLGIKRFYNVAPAWIQVVLVTVFWALRAGARSVTGKDPFRSERGMSVWYDAIDWLGGLPYEYARPDEVIYFLTKRGLCMVRAFYTRRSGCNEFVFIKGR